MLQNEVSIPYYIWADLSSFIHYPSPLAIPHLYPHTLTSTLTTKTTINRVFQTKREGVRVEKEKNSTCTVEMAIRPS